MFSKIVARAAAASARSVRARPSPAAAAAALFHTSRPLNLRVGDAAPEFSADSTHGVIDTVAWRGDSWVLFVSHPADFTPVCTTELGSLAKRHSEFDSRNVKVLAHSVDRVAKHNAWAKDVAEYAGMDRTAALPFPIVEDADRKISEAFDMVDQEFSDEDGLPLTVRSVFLIDPAGRVRLNLAYPHVCGRNWDEVLRCIDSIQLATANPIVTPCQWTPGQPVLVPPSVATEDAKKMYPEVEVWKPYFRTIPAPITD